MLLHIFKDEFDFTIRKTLKTTAPAVYILMKRDPDKAMYDKYHKIYRSGVVKLFHLVKW